MILTITDEGDPTVGMFPQSWNIECPFNKDDVTQEDLDWFKYETVNIYKEFCNGRIIAMYDYEFEQMMDDE